MYESLKKIAKQIFPKSVLKNNEEKLRKLIALRYKGTAFTCNVCGQNLKQFVALKNGEELCPSCGCLPRTRRLLLEIEKIKDLDKKTILHFSPPKGLKTKLAKLGAKKYITTDFEAEFEADKKLDITNINEPNNTYDIIICYHVLEHIVEDQKAMQELFRILKPNGVCYIQTPFKDGEIYENDSIVSEKERLKHFGQEDHVRIYSVAGLVKRLKNAGFCTEINTLNLSNTTTNKHGFKHGDTLIKATK